MTSVIVKNGILKYNSKQRGQTIENKKNINYQKIKSLEFTLNVDHFINNQEVTASFHDNFVKIYEKIKDLNTLSLNLKLQCASVPQLRQEMIQFIQKQIIQKHKSSINYLQLEQISLFEVYSTFTNSEEQDIEQFLISLILPIENLKGISFKEQSKDLYRKQILILQRALQQITQHANHFKCLQYLKLNYVLQNNSSEKNRKADKELNIYFLNSFKIISKIKSLNQIDIFLNGFHFDYSFYQGLLSYLLKLNCLASLGIDFRNNKLNPCSFLSFLKMITDRKAQSLKSLTLIDAIQFNKKESQMYSVMMKRFINLQSIQIQGISIMKNEIKNFFEIFQHSHNLKKLELDLEQFQLDHYFEFCFSKLSSLTNLETIFLIFPKQKKIQKRQTQAISTFVSSCQHTLKDIHLVLNNVIEDDILLINQLVEIENLERIKIECCSNIEDEDLKEIKLEIQAKHKQNQNNISTNIHEIEKQKIELKLVFIDENNQIAIQTLEFIVLLQFAIVCSSKNLKRLKLKSYTFLEFIDLFSKKSRSSQLKSFISKLATFKGIEYLDIYDFENLDKCIQKLIENNIDSLIQLSATPDIFNQYDFNFNINSPSIMIKRNKSSNLFEQQIQKLDDKNNQSDYEDQISEKMINVNKLIIQENKEFHNKINQGLIKKQNIYDKSNELIEQGSISYSSEKYQSLREQDYQNQEEIQIDANIISYSNLYDFESQEILEIERKKQDQNDFYEFIFKCKKLIKLEMNYYVMQSGFPYSKILKELPLLQSLKIPLYYMEFNKEDIQNTLNAKYLSKLEDVEYQIEYSSIPYIYTQHKRSIIYFIFAFENTLQPDFDFNPLHSIWDLYI